MAEQSKVAEQKAAEPAKEPLKDRMGRTFNPHVHDPDGSVDADGFLKVRRRDPSRLKLGPQLELRDTLDVYREAGYEYRYVNQKAGRGPKFEANGWEPVMDPAGGQVTMVVNPRTGQLSGATGAVLMRKPTEWFEEDRKARAEANRVDFKAKVAVDPSAVGVYSGLTTERDPRVQ